MIKCHFENGGQGSLRHVVVHGIVEKDGALLLEKRDPKLLEGGKWCLPGGFLNRDETLEEGIVREIREETGWLTEVVKLLRFNSDPNRPHEDRQNVAFDYLLRPVKIVGTPDQESSKVEWVKIDNLLPFDQFAFDHGESIRLYLEGK